MNHSARVLYATATAVVAGLAVACGGSGDTSGDTVAIGAPAASGDTMAGMDHTQMAGMDHGPAKDADHAFLREMSDHHEGLILIAGTAHQKAAADETRQDAEQLHMKQMAERDTMVTVIRTAYNETHQPTAMPKNRAQNDTLQSLSGAAADRKFYQLVIQHHREGIAMIDSVRPQLQRQNVQRMADRMKQEQQREIAEFQRKAGG